MAYVKFISDAKLENIVSEILESGKVAKTKADTKFNRNVIDPFAVLFEMASFSLNEEKWVMGEKVRQAQKSLSNHTGLMHQKIIGSIAGWEDLKTGHEIDVVNKGLKIIAEIKNKHNTIKGANKVDLYNEFNELIMPKASKYKDYTAYYVEIIPKKSERFNIPFVPSNKRTGNKCPVNVNIRQIDGASFYDLVTGQKNALADLFIALPKVIEKCSGSTAMLQTKVARKCFKKAYGIDVS